MTDVSNSSALLHIGFVERAFGIKGGLKIRLFDPQSQSLQTNRSLILIPPLKSPSIPLFQRAKLTAITITSVMSDGRILTNLSTRTEAEQFIGAQVYIEKSQLPALEKDEFYLADVIGFAVHNLKGLEIGSIVGFSSNGAQHLVEIKTLNQSIVLIPFIKPLLVDIQHENRVVVMDPPQELMN